MRGLIRPAEQVRRRLSLGRFVSCWVAILALALAVAALVEAARVFKLAAVPVSTWAVVGAAALVSLLGAGLWTWWRRPSLLDAAFEIDRAFALDERLSTVLSLPEAGVRPEVAEALVRDTERRLEGIDVRSGFGLKRPKLAWAPIIPALLIGLLSVVPQSWLSGKEAEAKGLKSTSPEARRQTSQVLKKVGQTMAEKRKQQPKAATGETGKVLAELEKAIDALSKAPPADRKQALVELNKMADTVQERRKQVGGLEQMTRQLEQLKEMTAGTPAEEMGRELARGNFDKAAQQMKSLQEKMKSGGLSEKEKEELAKQLGDLKKQLEQMAGLEQQRKQLEDARKNGLISEQQYQDQKAKLDQQASDLKSLQQLAQKLGEAQQQMAAGDMKKAAESLSSMQEQLEQMADAAQQIEALDGALADLQDAKEALAGEGMSQVGQQLEAMIGMAQSGNRPGEGQGLGKGRGRGDRSEAPDDTASFKSKVRQQFTKGKAMAAGFADPSRQVRGESILEGQETVEAAAAAATEALVDQKIPQSMRKHVQNYFDRVRTGG